MSLFGTSEYNVVLQDGRDMSKAELINLSSSSLLKVGTASCFYLDENFEYRRGQCAEKRSYICEYKGK